MKTICHVPIQIIKSDYENDYISWRVFFIFIILLTSLVQNKKCLN